MEKIAILITLIIVAYSFIALARLDGKIDALNKKVDELLKRRLYE